MKNCLINIVMESLFYVAQPLTGRKAAVRVAIQNTDSGFFALSAVILCLRQIVNL
jgi:hypothetical protein